MGRAKGSRFFQGLLLGTALTLLSILALRYQAGAIMISGDNLSTLNLAWNWIYANLGMSVPVFTLLLCLYVTTLIKLEGELKQHPAAERVAQLDHLLDTWTSLFFGVGVIWTAIGMRSALVFALGEPEISLSLGAYAILERMVQGGILLALSTTIVGGIGGYLLRVVKTLTVESDIKRFYEQLAQEPSEDIQLTLHAIERHLRVLSDPARN